MFITEPGTKFTFFEISAFASRCVFQAVKINEFLSIKGIINVTDKCYYLAQCL
jgi:hypothetical protein